MQNAKWGVGDAAPYAIDFRRATSPETAADLRIPGHCEK